MCMYIFTAYLRFSQTAYTFAEEDGTGSVMVEGTPGFEAIVIGGRWKQREHFCIVCS